ncbi:MAG: DNA polymerase III subunit beta [Bacilli bacterium]|nr:DNA polymerase III subunit beta [Bacilli bacterium]
MKFTIEKSVILEALNNVSKAISSRNIIPILNGIKFELKKEGLYLTASDSELNIKQLIDIKDIKNVEKEGIIIIQSKYLLDIIRKMPSDTIDFEVVDGLKVKIFTENSQYNLNCMEASEYPTIKIEESKDPIVINSNKLKNIIHQTIFAISTQELRPLLTGLNLKIMADNLECVATDSYRLAKKTEKIDSKSEVNIILPGKNIIELEKTLPNDENVEIHIFSNKVLFKFLNIYFQTNLLAGNYPNTNNLIPTEFKYIVKINLSEFFSSIDRAALLTQGKDKNIVKMTINDNKMIINSFASEIGKVEETLNIESNNKEKLEISFSSKYMIEALRTFKDEEILLLLNSDIKPIIIKSVEDESLIQLILPIKTY